MFQEPFLHLLLRCIYPKAQRASHAKHFYVRKKRYFAIFLLQRMILENQVATSFPFGSFP